MPEADPLQLSMLRINPVTAALLLSEFVTLQPGDWVIQNAANSSVGRAAIAFAKLMRVRTVNVVRRLSVMEEIGEIGADVVILDRQEHLTSLAKVIGDTPIRLGLDAIGGDATVRIAAALARNATLVSYGHMSGNVSTSADLRRHQLRHVTDFSFASSQFTTKTAVFAEMAVQLLQAGNLYTPISAVYPVNELPRAITRAMEGGKVILDLRPGRWT